MSVRVRVDRLVLDGFAVGAGEARAIGAAIETELARVLAATGLASSLERGAARERLRVPGIADASGPPGRFGAEIARAVGWSMSEPSANEQRGGT